MSDTGLSRAQAEELYGRGELDAALACYRRLPPLSVHGALAGVRALPLHRNDRGRACAYNHLRRLR